MLNKRLLPALLLSYGVISASHAANGFEDSIVDVLQDIQNANLDTSLDQINELIESHPNSQLSYLLLADILAARTGALPAVYKAEESNNKQLKGLRDELAMRWSRHKDQLPFKREKIPADIIKASPSNPYIIAVDSSMARLFVYENTGTGYRLETDFYISIGKEGMGKQVEGDQKTPIGVYFVTDYLDGQTLPDRYGPGAFPINYPNGWDRRHKKTGYGIWLHGTESISYSRVPLASDGCISLSNDEFLKIKPYISPSVATPVIISPKFEWVEQTAQDDLFAEFEQRLENWAFDWSSLNTDAYLSHYSPTDFNSGRYDFDQWVTYKRRVNADKEFIEIEMDDINIFRYPGEEDLVVTRFQMNYISNDYVGETTKSLYWQQLDGQWKIVTES